MGCTHYPLLRSLLRSSRRKRTLVNPAYETSQACALCGGSGNDELGRQKYQFFASHVERFNAFAHSVLPEQISDTKQVQIEPKTTYRKERGTPEKDGKRRTHQHPRTAVSDG